MQFKAAKAYLHCATAAAEDEDDFDAETKWYFRTSSLCTKIGILKLKKSVTATTAKSVAKKA